MPQLGLDCENSGKLFPARSLAAHDKMSVPLELSDLSRNQLWRQIRGFSRSPLGKASTKGKLRSDPSAPAHRHKLAVFPHQVVDGNRGQREGDDGRDTNTTKAGRGQADLVRPLATATVCSVSGLRIGTVLGGEPHGPGSPWIVKVMAATEDTEVESPRSEGFFLESQQLLIARAAAGFIPRSQETLAANS